MGRHKVVRVGAGEGHQTLQVSDSLVCLRRRRPGDKALSQCCENTVVQISHERTQALPVGCTLRQLGFGLLQGSCKPIHQRVIVSRPELWKDDRKSTRLNSSHVRISYAVFCLKKKRSIDKMT